jgi:hypothetical protein
LCLALRKPWPLSTFIVLLSAGWMTGLSPELGSLVIRCGIISQPTEVDAITSAAYSEIVYVVGLFASNRLNVASLTATVKPPPLSALVMPPPTTSPVSVICC